MPFEVLPKKPFHDAVDKVADLLNVQPDFIINQKRSPKAVRGRTIVSRYLHKRKGYSLSRIGRLFGLHHTTILHYLKDKS